jgi:hypothetical protein
MPSAIRLPQTASPLDVLVIACENQERAALPAVVDDASPAGGQGASNPTEFSNCHDAPASASTASDVASVAPRTVSPIDEIAALFREPSTQPTKKRSRKRLSDDEKIDSALAALEGVRAVRTLLLAAIKPAAASSNPAMDLMVDCLSFAVENIESCASALELACTNTSAKRCANQAHRRQRWLLA